MLRYNVNKLRLYQATEVVSAKSQISLTVWQWVPNRRAGHREGT